MEKLTKEISCHACPTYPRGVVALIILFIKSVTNAI